ncbi:hypothetical protein P167DRAFT_550601 [Morchella conica CCBAS932]|uniref:Uncharacterized protein n=1 Tax=Morchella conica CCBAS932 TaxID=1392247 RepID=A0A3N4KKG8_9PEZI|nr:hypothetical protein P167DRAFT_550601 [Morchella conica CCBAS932]
MLGVLAIQAPMEDEFGVLATSATPHERPSTINHQPTTNTIAHEHHRSLHLTSGREVYCTPLHLTSGREVYCTPLHLTSGSPLPPTPVPANSSTHKLQHPPTPAHVPTSTRSQQLSLPSVRKSAAGANMTTAMPKFTNLALMNTKAGTLTGKSPPYLQGQKKADCVRSHRLSDLITKQFTPFLARQATGQAAGQSAKPKKSQSDRGLERNINKWMCLSECMEATCEKVKANGARFFKIFKGKIGSVIEVFFDVDVSQPLNNVGTLVNRSLGEINHAALTYEQVEVPAVSSAFYLAFDKNYTSMFDYFSKGFEMVYRVEIGNWVLDSTTYNIVEYTELQPPDIPGTKNIRHSEYKNWLLANSNLCCANWSEAGVYHWGM